MHADQQKLDDASKACTSVRRSTSVLPWKVESNRLYSTGLDWTGLERDGMGWDAVGWILVKFVEFKEEFVSVFLGKHSLSILETRNYLISWMTPREGSDGCVGHTERTGWMQSMRCMPLSYRACSSPPGLDVSNPPNVVSNSHKYEPQVQPRVSCAWSLAAVKGEKFSLVI